MLLYSCTTEKCKPFGKRFFVRQFKVLEGYILICREGFWLYSEKGGKAFDERFFSLYEFNPPKAIFLYAERAFGCIAEKDPSNQSNMVACRVT